MSAAHSTTEERPCPCAQCIYTGTPFSRCRTTHRTPASICAGVGPAAHAATLSAHPAPRGARPGVAHCPADSPPTHVGRGSRLRTCKRPNRSPVHRRVPQSACERKVRRVQVPRPRGTARDRAERQRRTVGVPDGHVVVGLLVPPRQLARHVHDRGVAGGEQVAARRPAAQVPARAHRCGGSSTGAEPRSGRRTAVPAARPWRLFTQFLVPSLPCKPAGHLPAAVALAGLRRTSRRRPCCTAAQSSRAAGSAA